MIVRDTGLSRSSSSRLDGCEVIREDEDVGVLSIAAAAARKEEVMELRGEPVGEASDVVIVGRHAYARRERRLKLCRLLSSAEGGLAYA